MRKIRVSLLQIRQGRLSAGTDEILTDGQFDFLMRFKSDRSGKSVRWNRLRVQ